MPKVKNWSRNKYSERWGYEYMWYNPVSDDFVIVEEIDGKYKVYLDMVGRSGGIKTKNISKIRKVMTNEYYKVIDFTSTKREAYSAAVEFMKRNPKGWKSVSKAKERFSWR